MRWPRVVYARLVCAALALVCAACSAAAPNTAVTAPPAVVATPSTPVQTTATVVLTTPTSKPVAATAAPQQAAPATSAVATPVPASADATPGAAAATVVPESAEATPDRPFGPRSRTTGCTAHDGLPDRACTPGAIFPDVTADQVCRRGYSTSVRNVPAAVSREVYREYGILERTTGEYEVDHSVALELGGSNDIANLWPEVAEPRPGFHEKDQVENYLHDAVCGGRMKLLEAQRAIATDWVQVYQHLRQPVLPVVAPTIVSGPPSPADGSGLRPDHRRVWWRTWRTGERQRHQCPRSVVLHHLSDSSRHTFNRPGVGGEDR